MRPTRPVAALATVLVAVGCSSGSGGGVKVTGSVTASGAADAQVATVDMTDSLTFAPNVVDAQAGHLVLTIRNTGKIPHDLVFDDKTLGRTNTVNGGATATLTLPLAKAGTYRFVCEFHSGMDGKVVVSG